jgi:glycosyltransferase involved in cell wall biosynthesis
MFIFKKTLKIAQIAPLIESVPPKKYGGTERVVHALTEELVERGHDVTLFASSNSKTSAKLESVLPKSLRESNPQKMYGLNEWLLLHLGIAYKSNEEFDIIHDHNGIYSLPVAQLSKTPVVLTMHGSVTPYNKRLYRDITGPSLVSISKSQTAPFPFIKTAANIYNGLPMKDYPFSKRMGRHLLYVGRICLDKGTHFAIDAAVDLNIPLIIAAKLDEINVPYFKEYIEPRIDNDLIKWVGEVDEKKRNQLMKNALCLLHPITWREPFGLTLIEAMATGCPVVAFNKGSIAEIVVNGKTGYVVEDLEAMIEAVKKVPEINRVECRQHALKNFNERVMTERYENLYYEILYQKEKEARETVKRADFYQQFNYYEKQ